MPDHAALARSHRDFWLCLARAFAPSAGAEYVAAFTTDLPADLEAIGEELGLNLSPELAAFRAAAADLADSLDLQRLYAALFLTPPQAVPLNTGLYLDGSLMGQSEQDLAAAYARHGFARQPGFRDLNDTVAVQAEFLGQLYDKIARLTAGGEALEARACLTEAQAFTAAYPARWITPMLREIEAATAARRLCPVFLHLARILWLGVESAITAPAEAASKAGLAALPAGSARGIGELTAEDLAEIAVRLSRDGLAWDHVAARPGWDEAIFAARQARVGAA
ncbi:ArxD, molecular chaperone TorD family protein (plasmid) [Cereibacter azotoformans]|uniref:molecular chaperone TorD family protein n=1 Tax=Cereibacter azotoformans TaxID=43057 RepID=UPI001EEC27A6|nr:molecular chaperone TorD family protein [Cereibacter azotoformans]ULB12476.1 ArxD, molecular chaperone TorD family protein [Cereibacter azotoformans]